MSEININKKAVLAEVAKGGTALEIATRMGIKLPILRQAAKAFNINLRSKPTTVVNFIDDTIETPTTVEALKKLPASDSVSTKLFEDTEL